MFRKLFPLVIGAFSLVAGWRPIPAAAGSVTRESVSNVRDAMAG